MSERREEREERRRGRGEGECEGGGGGYSSHMTFRRFILQQHEGTR